MLEYADGKQEYISTLQAAVCTGDDLADSADIYTLKQKLKHESKCSAEPDKLFASLLNDINLITLDIQRTLRLDHIPDILDIRYEEDGLYIKVNTSNKYRTNNKVAEIKKVLSNEIKNIYLHRLCRI